jgi:hypothetical protein
VLKKTVRDSDPKNTDQQEHARSDRLKEDKFKPAPAADTGANDTRVVSTRPF